MYNTSGALDEFFRDIQKQGDPNAHESVRTTEQPAWSGDGLPPVGTVVEYRNDGGWWPANVIGHYKDMAIVADVKDDMCVEMAREGCMRPIRNDEEKAVSALIEEFGNVCIGVAGDQRREYAEAVIRLGYRKTEGV